MRYLLENGLEGLDGVLFLDERDERVGKSEPRGRDGACAAWRDRVQVVLERDSRRVVELVRTSLRKLCPHVFGHFESNLVQCRCKSGVHNRSSVHNSTPWLMLRQFTSETL